MTEKDVAVNGRLSTDAKNERCTREHSDHVVQTIERTAGNRSECSLQARGCDAKG